MKKIEVYRETGWVGMISGVHLLLNGQKAEKIHNREYRELPLVDDEAILQTSTFGQKSNKVKVTDGDDLTLSTTFLGSYGVGLFVVMVILRVLLESVYLTAGTLLLGVILFITGFIPGLHHKLEKSKSKAC